jgi:hypothetical protein
MRYRLMLLIVVLFATNVFAQRTFVASTGLDTNPCSRTAPCRSFGTAITAVAAGGEVIVLDSAGYGPASITKSVSLIAPAGVYAGVTVTSGQGLIVNAPAGIVNVRGVNFNGVGGGDAIDFTMATELHVENVLVSGFTGSAMYAHTDGRFTVRDCEFRDNQYGIFLDVAPTLLEGSVDHTRFDQNTTAGTEQLDNTKMTIRDSVFFNNNNGARVFTGATSAELNIDNCTFSAGLAGLRIQALGQGTGVIRFGHSTFVNLNDAIERVGGGFVSFGNNAFGGNGADGTIDLTIPLK